MSTLAWLLIFGGLLVIRSVSKGRGITDIPGDMGDILTGVLTNDPAKIKDVLKRGSSSATDPVTYTSPPGKAADVPALGTGATSYMLGAVDPKLIPIANALGSQFHVKTISGYRADNGGYGDKDHASGKSIDMFTSSKMQGDAIAAELTSNPAKYNIKYVIWYQRIWYPGSGWRTMPDRGSDNNNHKNHVHLTIN